MSKLIARYFYSPICPESFATLNKLKNLFLHYPAFHFEYFDIFRDEMVSDYHWSHGENEIRYKTFRKPMLFAELFVEGKPAKGFPPSPGILKELFAKYNQKWNPALYPFSYSEAQHDKWYFNPHNLNFVIYDHDLSPDICRLCTKYHPYLCEEDYREEEWIEYEKAKLNFLQKMHNEKNLIGIIAYYKGEPAGFIESFSLSTGLNLGFPFSGKDTGLMITCLSIRKELWGNQIASGLIKKLEEEARKRKFASLQVIPFPDEHNWHPPSLYKKLGFTEAGDIFLLKSLL